MPTPAERQALIFFAAVAALGVGVNAWRAVRGGDMVIAGSPGDLAAQIARVDSAVASSPSRDRRQMQKGENARTRARETPAARPGPAASAGYRPPSADYRPPSADYRPPSADYRPPSADYRPPSAVRPMDLDFASVAAVESLPRIGPALARRVVANRDSFGPFGSLEGLQRVRGIGPGIAKALQSLVTFSGVPRQGVAAGAAAGSVKGRRRRSAP